MTVIVLFDSLPAAGNAQAAPTPTHLPQNTLDTELDATVVGRTEEPFGLAAKAKQQ